MNTHDWLLLRLFMRTKWHGRLTRASGIFGPPAPRPDMNANQIIDTGFEFCGQRLIGCDTICIERLTLALWRRDGGVEQ